MFSYNVSTLCTHPIYMYEGLSYLHVRGKSSRAFCVSARAIERTQNTTFKSLVRFFLDGMQHE